MEKYETFTIQNVSALRNNSIYFFLKSNGFSEHQIKFLRKNNKSFLLNGMTCTIKEKITTGDKLQVLINPNPGSTFSPCEGVVDILYEDEDFLLVNKPHLLACIPTRSHYSDNLGGRIINYMKSKDENFVLRIVNRLDKDTAGIVVIAKSASAYNKIGKIDKTYYAICHGKPNFSNFTINEPILTVCENGINQMKRIVSPSGKPSTTHVTVLKQFDKCALIKLKLETGRTHQIRVHLSHIGHSLIGDNIYSNNKNESTAHTFLILKEVSFLNPRTSKLISISIPFPEDWREFLSD